MQIVALYKVWDFEWLESSIKSIIDHVDKIVLLYSDISWTGLKGNPSKELIEKLAKDEKIIPLRCDEQDQIQHCYYGFKWIKENLKCDFIQLIDADEVWDDFEYNKAKEYLKKNPDYPAYRTKTYAYIKSPYLRVEPPLSPVCFISPNLESLGQLPRGYSIRPHVTMPVKFHHFILVRSSFNKILEKMIQNYTYEGLPYEEMDVWIPEVWNKLPDYNKEIYPDGFMPVKGFNQNWKTIRRITNLPAVLNNMEGEQNG